MRYSFISVAILASVSSVFGQTAGFDAISVPAQDQVVHVGDVLNIVWAPNGVAGTVKIQLLEGATPSTLNYDPVIVAASVNNLDGTFAWTVPASVGSYATYGFQITNTTDAGIFQWSNHFIIEAATSSASSTVVATSTASPVVDVASSSIIVSSASVAVATIAAGSHVTTASPAPSSLSPMISGAARPSNNGTYQSATLTSVLPSKTGGASNSSSTSPVIATGAASNIVATGGMAMLGMLLAFVL